jgi:hypothetical protein
MPELTVSRRRFLRRGVAVAAVGTLAGCGSTGDDGTTNPETTRDGSDSPSDGGTEAEDETAGTETATLDLREANVVGVETMPTDDGYRFAVTLHHDDEGEPGYANWWQVERRDGTRLGRRDLRHPHDSQPFTRDATVSVPSDVSCVVVRGHDQTHGYGGRAMLVTPETGATRRVEQGTDRQSLDGADCP